MVAPPEVPHNVEGAQAKAALVDDGLVQRGQQYKHYKGQRPLDPRPDDSYSYQPSPEPSQYSAFDNTH
jgi:hypothetical protein